MGEEGRPLEEVTTKRWGSLERIRSMIKSAGVNPDTLSGAPANNVKD